MEAREIPLGFGHVKCTRLLRVLTWHSQGQSLTLTSLRNALSELSLPRRDNSPTSSALFIGFKDQPSNLRKVQMLCVLLGRGKRQRKAEEIWTMCDAAGEGKMAVTTVAQMCHDLLSVSIVDLGRLDTTGSVKDYLSGLKNLMGFADVMKTG